MAYLLPAELNSHLYSEIQTEISRNDAALMSQAIDAAIAEAEGYLSKYDQDAIFNATGVTRHPLVLLYVKDIAVWHYIQLANPNVDMALRERRYVLATDWLTKVQKGMVVPKDLPVPAPDPDMPQENNEVRYGSSRPRNNGYL